MDEHTNEPDEPTNEQLPDAQFSESAHKHKYMPIPGKALCNDCGMGPDAPAHESDRDLVRRSFRDHLRVLDQIYAQFGHEPTLYIDAKWLLEAGRESEVVRLIVGLTGRV
jgi:hypothetical protein